MDYEMQNFLEEFDHAENVHILTGAGVSTLSGIPDFRGKNGFYSGGDLWNGYRKEDLFDIDFFHEKPEVFYRFAAEYLYPMLEKTPSCAHILAAELQKRKMCGRIYTQNIDALHSKAGATEVAELHGTMQYSRCLRCSKRFSYDEVLPEVQAGHVPRCSACGGLIKPEVVFFGENLPEEALDHAIYDCENTDILLVMGTSLTVQPVASLPVIAYRNNRKVVIVNDRETPCDRMADYIFRDIQQFCDDFRCFIQM